MILIFVFILILVISGETILDTIFKHSNRSIDMVSKSMFRSFDINRDSRISQDEWILALTKLRKENYTLIRNVNLNFSKIDASGDNGLQITELKRFMIVQLSSIDKHAFLQNLSDENLALFNKTAMAHISRRMLKSSLEKCNCSNVGKITNEIHQLYVECVSNEGSDYNGCLRQVCDNHRSKTKFSKNVISLNSKDDAIEYRDTLDRLSINNIILGILGLIGFLSFGLSFPVSDIIFYSTTVPSILLMIIVLVDYLHLKMLSQIYSGDDNMSS